MNSLNLLIRRSFSTVASTSTPSKSTALYLWTSMPKLGPKASELKQQMQIPKGTPNRVESFDNLNIQRILIGLRHSAALSSNPLISFKIQMMESSTSSEAATGVSSDRAMKKMPALIVPNSQTSLRNEARKSWMLPLVNITQSPSLTMAVSTPGGMLERQACSTGCTPKNAVHWVTVTKSIISLPRKSSTLRNTELR